MKVADDDKLGSFIRAAKERGVADDFIVALLRQRGWPERRIYQALADYYEGVLGSPVPTRGSRIEQARDAFYYLLAFVTLGFWMVAFFYLADSLVDRAFPSPLDYSYAALTFRHEAAWSMATLLVAFPLFFFVNWIIAREVARRPDALESGVRKWLTYIALVLTAITLICDAVAFLTQFLTGDLTVRFALKALVLFVVAAGVFWYYLGTVRTELPARLRDHSFGWAAIVAVAAALALGFVNIGSPARERALSLDQRRVSDLSQIATAINRQWATSPKGRFALPATLDKVPSLGDVQTKDPVTSRPFEYAPTSGTTYKLCATFEAQSFTDVRSSGQSWNHPAGHYCYALDASVEPGYGAYVTQ